MNTGNDSIIKSAILKIIKPLVRLLMKHDISHGEFTEITKQAYVDVAYEHFSIPNRKMTYSRASVLTGLNRKEVVRLYKEDGDQPQKSTFSRSSRVITGWLNDVDFIDQDFQPKALPLKMKDAGFNKLVERYSGDVSAGAMLDELLRTGIVTVNDDNTVSLDSLGFVPDNSELEKIDILSACANNLLNTGVFNINKSSEDEARFQRQLSHGVSDELRQAFKTYSQQKSLELLLEFNHWIAEKKKIPTSDPGDLQENTANKRVGIGIYYFEESEST